MSEHYFTPHPSGRSDPFEIEIRVRERRLRLASDRGVFSAKRLDPGTRLLAETVLPAPGESVLDLGCGVGVLGILAALEGAGAVFLLDRNERAVALARENARRCGVADRALALCCDGGGAIADESLDLVLLNPPIRAGRAVVTRLIEEGARALRPGGRLGLVALTRQGAESLAKVLADRLAPPRLAARGSGYRVFLAWKGAAGASG